MNYVKELVERYPALADCSETIEEVIDTLTDMHLFGNKLLLAGNGGSAADASHISGEFLKGFLLKRPYENQEPPFDKLQQGVAAIPLNTLDALLSAFANDVDPDFCYAQLVGALGREGDVFMGLSTSGNAKNVYWAAKAAKELGLITVGLTGAGGGKLAELCDYCIKVPETETFKIQELHLPVYHAICAQVEANLYEE
ncbi:MAG: SIS domain-containing protein [Clostridia bacterium]|nr:SIS domain-containing protein [Clostridia bacterium]